MKPDSSLEEDSISDGKFKFSHKILFLEDYLMAWVLVTSMNERSLKEGLGRHPILNEKFSVSIEVFVLKVTFSGKKVFMW